MYEKTQLLVYNSKNTLLMKHEILDKKDFPELLDNYTIWCKRLGIKSDEITFYLANTFVSQDGECIEKIDSQQVKFKIIL